MAATVGFSIIARNAGATLRECLESIAPYADQLVIGLGGPSTDDTEAIAREFTEEVYQLKWHDDFARARQEVWDKLTTDYGAWCDADDILVGGEYLREYVDKAPSVDMFMAAYHYAQDEHGNLSCILYRERLLKNPSEWVWDGPVHEALIAVDQERAIERVVMDKVVVQHNPKRNQDKGTRNLDILYRELERTEPEPSQRLLLYLFRENAARENYKEALLHANRFMSMATYDDEAYQVAIGIVDMLMRARRFPEAGKAALKAIEIRPDWPDAYFMLARLAFTQGRFQEAVEWTKAGGDKEPPRTSAIIDPRQYNYFPYYYLGLAYAGLGDWEMAAANLAKAAEVMPDERIIEQLRAITLNMDRQRVLDAVKVVYETLGRWDEWIKVRKFMRVIPKIIENTQEISDLHQFVLDVTQHIEDPQAMLDFYDGNTGWVAASDEMILSENYGSYPRLAFARKSISCAPPATILEIGSSDGFISLPLAKDGHIVTGYDLDPRCIELANERAVKWGYQDPDGPVKNGRARYLVGSIGDVDGKYDVALCMEIIEHLVDPGAFLDQVDEHARKVVITTPFMAWENGRWPDWEKRELKGHIRIFDLVDIETLLSHRGRIFDLYREPFGQSGWIFASYRPRQEYEQNIVFLAPGTLEEWSPRKLAKEGLGGSETALIRLAEELFIGAKSLCTVYGRIDDEGYYNGVRYRGLQTFEPGVRSDVFVAWRYPEAADLSIRTGRMVLWLHDTDAGDRLTPARAARFEAIVVLSEWHKQHVLKVYPWLDESKLVVIGNGVEVARFAPDEKNRPDENIQREAHRVAYTSSPDRGLDAILEHVWPLVVEQVPDAELHVYYGLQNLDILKNDYPQIAEFKHKLVELLGTSKGVVQHGRVPQDVLARELQRASVWLYPSHNFDETYCISAVEAQLAGAIPVTSNRGALAETVGSGVIIEGTIGQAGVAEAYAQAIVDALTAQEEQLAELRATVREAAPAHDWSEISGRWAEEVLHAHATIEGSAS